jgi:hypothetical protein
MKEFELLINAGFPFIEELLIKYGEFFPLAATINTNEEIALVSAYEDEEQPESEKLIINLKNGLKKDFLNRNYKAVAIFLNAMVNKADAIVVFAESQEHPMAYNLIYPYTITENNSILFGESWKEETEKEILIVE